MIAFLTIFLLAAAFVLLLLISLSLPIIKAIYLFSLTVDVSASVFNADVNTNARFGMWGYCVGAVKASVGIFHDNTAGFCTKAHLGYGFDNNLIQLFHISKDVNILAHAITTALIIHPIACGLTFIALLFSLVIPFRHIEGRIFAIFTLVTTVLAALLTTIVFLIDIALVAVTRNRIKNATDGDVTANWGNAVWMCLGAAVALWAACVGACCGICACGGGSRRTRKGTY